MIHSTNKKDNQFSPKELTRQTINPYTVGFGVISRRLFWDLHPQSWLSRSIMRSWKNRYAGERAIIVCNGPSLNEIDLSLLKGTFTFGLNKINLLFHRDDFRPDCIVAVNPLVIQQNANFFNETQIPLFLDSFAATRRIVSFRRNVCYLHSGPRGFAQDCSVSVAQGHTVTYVAMQLAFHMGFKSVSLIGCDHSFAVEGPPNKTVKAEGADQSHFDPSYFSDGAKWQLPDLAESEAAYSMAKEIYSANQRKLVNSTIGGKLEILERQSLGEFLAS